jgi:hypothetical protein
MTLRNYLWFMGAGTAFAAGALALILATVDPDTASGAVFAIFYACVFLAVTGLLSIIGFTARVFLLSKRLFISQEVAISFRQSMLIGALVVCALYLKSRDQLNWWTALLIVALLTLLEFFFISAKVRRPEGPRP